MKLEDIEFLGELPSKYKPSLESLFFFNPKQKLNILKIEKAIDRYGYPRIIVNNGNIKIDLEKSNNCQNLFLVRKDIPVVLGVIIHTRTDKTTAELIHFAVDSDYEGRLSILENMLKEIYRIYGRIKDIEKIKITYINRIMRLNHNG